MSAPTIEAAGIELAFEDRGEGRPLLLVHGSATARTIWRETVNALGAGFRTIVYDRRGYGDSGAPEDYSGTTVEEQSEDAATLLRKLDLGRVLACGHSFGALVTLDLLLRHPDLVAGAVIAEPPLLALSPAGPEFAGGLREAALEGARESGAAGVVDAIAAYACGEDVSDRLGPDRLEAARQAARACAADLVAGPRWPLERARLRRLDAPVIVVTGARTPAVWREVGEATARALGRAEHVELDAGHMVQLDDPRGLARQIERLEARVER